MAVCFTIERKRYYYKLQGMPYQKEKYFNEVCSVTSSRSALMPVYKEWQKILDGYREKLIKLNKTQSLTIDLIRSYLTGEGMNGELCTSFVGVWESIIERMKREGRVGTEPMVPLNMVCAQQIIQELPNDLVRRNSAKYTAQYVNRLMSLVGGWERSEQEKVRGLHKFYCDKTGRAKYPWMRKGYTPINDSSTKKEVVENELPF